MPKSMQLSRQLTNSSKQATRIATSRTQTSCASMLSSNKELKDHVQVSIKLSSLTDSKGKQPSRLQIVARAKYDAWKALGNLSKRDAKLGMIKALQDKMPKFKPKL